MSFPADFWDPWPHLAVSSYRSGKSLFLFIIYRSPNPKPCTYRTLSSPLPCRTSWIVCWAPSSNAHSLAFLPRIPAWQSLIAVKAASSSGFLGRWWADDARVPPVLLLVALGCLREAICCRVRKSLGLECPGGGEMVGLRAWIACFIAIFYAFQIIINDAYDTEECCDWKDKEGKGSFDCRINNKKVQIYK